MALFEFHSGVIHGAGGVLEQALLLFGAHHPKQ
jgi:hypothetical protein